MQRRIGQVIAPLFVVLRVANKSAVTNDTIASGHISGFEVQNRGDLTGGGDAGSSVDERGMDSGELAAGVATTDIDSHQDRTQGSPDLDALHN